MYNTLKPALQTLLSSADEALIAAGTRVADRAIWPGQQVAWDNCCAGQLWVRVLSITPYPPQNQPCRIQWLDVTVGVGVIRCVNGLQDNRVPTPEETTFDGEGMTDDAFTLLGALTCTELPNVLPKSLSVIAGTPQGVEGACGGWEWTARFKLNLCDDCG